MHKGIIPSKLINKFLRHLLSKDLGGNEKRVNQLLYEHIKFVDSPEFGIFNIDGPTGPVGGNLHLEKNEAQVKQGATGPRPK